MRCNDCGSREFVPSARSDVCVNCLELRLQLIKAVEAGTVHMDEFQQLQRVIASGRGQAACAIRRTLGLSAPEI